MKKIKIITDSNSGLTQEEGEGLGVFVIPMPFTVNGEEFEEGISITQAEFYEKLKGGADVKTSQPSEVYLENLWEDFLKDFDEIVYIPMSGGLSSSCENAKRYAEKFGAKVEVVDNRRISVGQKESVFEAARLVKLGKSAAEIKEYLEKTGKTASIYIMLDTLKYIKKGGRISPAAALIGDMLRLKPILYTRGDKFEKFGQAMSLGQAKTLMIKKIREEVEGEFREEYDSGKMVVSVAHTQNEEEALRFKELILKQLPGLTFRFVDPLSLSVACHIGAGALAISICVDNYLN